LQEVLPTPYFSPASDAWQKNFIIQSLNHLRQEENTVVVVVVVYASWKPVWISVCVLPQVFVAPVPSLLGTLGVCTWRSGLRSAYPETYEIKKECRNSCPNALQYVLNNSTQSQKNKFGSKFEIYTFEARRPFR
jgi:hypothetical protein